MSTRTSLRERYRQGLLDKHGYALAMTEQHRALTEYVTLLSGSDIERIELTDDGLWLHSRLAPVAFACDPQDRGTPPMVALNFGSYERAEFEMWRRLVRPGATVADVGANIGWYCAHMAALDRDARVVALEPVPSSFGWLCKTLSRNGLCNVVAEQLGLSDRPGTMNLHVDPTIAGAASAHPTVYTENASVLAVQTTTLDLYGAAHGLVFDAIKLDVEGAELLVFQGAARVLTEQRPVVFCEMLRRHARAFGYHPNDIISLLESHGYRCFRLCLNQLIHFTRMDEDTQETNFFFLHPEAHASVLGSVGAVVG